MTEESEKIPRLTKIWARNFRSIESLELELAPLTVLVGPNASGKSNIADIPAFASEALLHGLDFAITARGGAGLRRGTEDISIDLSIDLQDAQVDYGFSTRIESNGRQKVMRETASAALHQVPSDKITVEVKEGRFTRPSEGQLSDIVRPPLWNLTDIYFDVWGSDPNGLAMPFRGIMGLLYGHKMETVVNFRIASSFLGAVKSYRIFPDALRYPQQISGNAFLDADGKNLASILLDMKENHPENFAELISALNHLVPSIIDIDAEQAGGHLAINFTHKSDESGRKRVLVAFQESDGTLRILGLLAVLYQEPHPVLAIIEEPEIAIHPGALAYIAELMDEVASLRMQLLVTTHSPDFLDLVPVNSIRAVELSDRGTIAEPIADDQRNAVANKLFTPGELHSMEGLRVSGRFG